MAENKIKSIILIDDETSVLFALKLLLGALGFEVKDYSDPVLASDSFAADTTSQLILCDLRMPKIDGLGVLGKARELRPDIPFVLMSAHAGHDEINKAKKMGAFGFLAKPFTPDQLRELIAKVEETMVPLAVF